MPPSVCLLFQAVSIRSSNIYAYIYIYMCVCVYVYSIISQRINSEARLFTSYYWLGVGVVIYITLSTILEKEGNNYIGL
jgi:hypothetical protein